MILWRGDNKLSTRERDPIKEAHDNGRREAEHEARAEARAKRPMVRAYDAGADKIVEAEFLGVAKLRGRNCAILAVPPEYPRLDGRLIAVEVTGLQPRLDD